jgi:hypothetical protein
MAAFALLGVALSFALGGTPAWGDAAGYCDGDIRCSSYVSDIEGLLDLTQPAGGFCGGGQDTPVVDGRCCKYGHEPADGICSRPCDSRKSDGVPVFNEEVCRCVSLEFQEVRNRVLAVPDLVQAALALFFLIVAGGAFIKMLCSQRKRARKLREQQQAQDDPSEAASGKKIGRNGREEADPKCCVKAFLKFGLTPCIMFIIFCYLLHTGYWGIIGVLEPSEAYYNGCQNAVHDRHDELLGGQ